jgi:hypothetical protein
MRTKWISITSFEWGDGLAKNESSSDSINLALICGLESHHKLLPNSLNKSIE